MAKIDKETLIKNRFWVMLVGVVPLVLVALIWLKTVVASANAKDRLSTEEVKSKLQKQADGLQGTEDEFKALREKVGKLKEKRQEVWKAAWDIQKDLMTWPKAREFAGLDKLYFGDPLGETPEKDEKVRVAFAMDKTGYRSQFEEVVKLVEPGDFEGGWEKALPHVRQWRRQEGPPSTEEVWLAQEDLWVQRELFLAIREANDVVGKLKKIDKEGERAPKPDVSTKDKERFRERFANPYWQVDLTIVEPTTGKFFIRGTIKNVAKQRQVIKELKFKTYLSNDPNDPDAEELIIQGGIVGAGQEVPLQFKVEDAKALQRLYTVKRVTPPDGLFGVDQVMDGATVPVKRIVKVVIPYHSDRTYLPLEAPFFSRLTEAKKAEGDSTEAKDKGPLLLPSNKTPNGLERLRYYYRTAQVRRMPIGIVMLVDQAHVQDVLTAFANSKRPGCILRLQPTQVDWHRFRSEFRPGGGTKAKDKGKAAPPPDPALDKDAPPSEQQFTMVEMAFYGVASLYERYPPRPPPAAEGTEKAAK
jgi:hypothetical protein